MAARRRKVLLYGLGVDQVGDGGPKALHAPAAEEPGVPSVRLAIAPLRS